MTTKRLYEVDDVAFAVKIIMQIRNVKFINSGGGHDLLTLDSGLHLLGCKWVNAHYTVFIYISRTNYVFGGFMATTMEYACRRARFREYYVASFTRYPSGVALRPFP